MMSDVVRRRYRRRASGDMGRAETLEAVTRDYLAAGYEITAYQTFAVQLRAPRRFRPMRFILGLVAVYVLVAFLTTSTLAAVLTAALSPLQLIWELVVAPRPTITLLVDEAGHVVESS